MPGRLSAAYAYGGPAACYPAAVAAEEAAPGGGGGASGEDELLLQAASQGDRDALGSLYDRFAPDMLALAQRFLGSPREAEDLVHDVFLEAWHRARHYDRQRGTVRTWLMLRVRSRALDRLRSARRAAWVGLDEARLTEKSEPDGPERARDRGNLRGVIADLPHDQRAVLELGYFRGYSCAEIASQLDIPLGTVKSRMSRAISALRTRLQEGGRP